MPKKLYTDVKPSLKLKRINSVGNALNKIGIQVHKLDPQKIVKQACADAGYSKAIPSEVVEGLNTLIRSLNTEANLNPYGYKTFKHQLLRNLTLRLHLENEFEHFEKVKHQKIKEPVFIIGMPKTGARFLHATLSTDPEKRSPLNWECTQGNKGIKLGMAFAQKDINDFFNAAPGIKNLHSFNASSPQDCLGIFALNFCSYQYSGSAHIPTYNKWCEQEKNVYLTLQFHKRFLQYLQFKSGKQDRWLLKSPLHVAHLPQLLEIYPDAKIIFTHRKPKETLAATCSLISSLRMLYSDKEDLNRTGQEQINMWTTYYDNFVEVRKKLKDRPHILDLKFKNIAEHPLLILPILYEFFGWELNDDIKEGFKVFADKNPEEVYQYHKGELRNFGLEEELVAQRFKSYLNFIDEI
jgi:hypothetical protein